MKPPNLQGCRGVSMFPKGWKKRGTCVGVLGHAPFQVIESLSWGMPPPKKNGGPSSQISSSKKQPKTVSKSASLIIFELPFANWHEPHPMYIFLYHWLPEVTLVSLPKVWINMSWITIGWFFSGIKSIGWSGDSKRNSFLVCFCCVWCSSYWSSDDHICQICPAAQSSNLQVQ